MFLVVLIGPRNETDLRRAAFNGNSELPYPPKSSVKPIRSPVTKHSPNTTGIAATPYATALRAATKTGIWYPDSRYFLSPYFYLVDNCAKDWLILYRLTSSVVVKAFEVDTLELQDTLYIIDLMCYDLTFNSFDADVVKNASVLLAKHPNTLPLEDSQRLRYKYLDALDAAQDATMPKFISEHAGFKSRLSTKCAAYTLGKLIGTVDS